MSEDNSPSAFPLGANEYGGHGSQGGMTLRDYFAAKAMQAAITARGERGHDFEYINEPELAKRSYRMADYMLEVRDA